MARRNPLMPLTGALFVNPLRMNLSNRMRLAKRAYYRAHPAKTAAEAKARRAGWKKASASVDLRKRLRKGAALKSKMLLDAYKVGRYEAYAEKRKARRAARKSKRAASRKTRAASRKSRKAAAPKAATRKASRKSRKARKSSRKGGGAKRQFSPKQLAAQAAFAAKFGGKAARKTVKAKANRGRFRSNWRRNTGIPGMGLVTGTLSRVPGLAPVAAVLPTAVLAVAGAYVNSKFIAPRVGRFLPAQLTPVAGSVTGVAVAAVAKVAKVASRFLPRQVAGVVAGALDLVAGASVLAGVLADVTGFAKSKGLLAGFGDFGDEFGDDFGDEFGDVDGLTMQGLAMQGLGDGMAYALGGLYADAEMGDAFYSGDDLSQLEGDAALAGEYAWVGTFGRPPRRAAGPRKQHSQHAGKHGHRWGWLIKLVGMQNFRKIAALEPKKRLAVIKSLREQAVSSLPGLLTGGDGGGSPAGETAGLGYGYGEYGALVFAGQ